MEVAHAPIASAKTVGSDLVNQILLRGAVREVARELVAAAQCCGRGHHPWRQRGWVGEGVDVNASGAGERHRSLSRTATAAGPAELACDGAVRTWLQGEHVPDFDGSVVALIRTEAYGHPASVDLVEHQ